MPFGIAVSLLTLLPSAAGTQAVEGNFLSAAWSGQVVAVRSMLENGRVDVNVTRNDGSSALMLASLAGHEEVVDILLESGADSSARNEDGETPLILASTYGFTGVAAKLIEAGADVNAADSYGRNAQTWATWGENERLSAILTRSGAEPPGVTDPFERGAPLLRFEKVPELKKLKPPKLPKTLSKASFDAEIIVRLVVGRDGKPHSIELEDGYQEELDAAVLEAMEKWRYEPGEVQGKRVEGVAHAVITYYRGQREPKVMTRTARWRN